jgi:hypothetical protein
MRKIIAVLAVLAALSVVAACAKPADRVDRGDNPPQQNVTPVPIAPPTPVRPGPKRFAVGEHARLTLSDGSTADIVVSAIKVQGRSIVATVTYQCTAGVVSYNGLDWSARAADGTELDQAFDMGVKNQLSTGELAAGQKVTGTIPFTGSSATGVTVTFSPTVSPLAYWVNP